MSSKSEKQPIVSSRHLATGETWQLSEFEFGLIVAHNGFSRWITRCMAAAGNPALSALETLVLHNVNHRDRAKRLSDICFLLNIEDTHTVNYALKKLRQQGLVSGEKQGKEIHYQTTPEGRDLCVAYAEVRSQCLLDSLDHLGLNKDDLSDIASTLRTLSGLYDQAARAASSL